MYQIAFGRPPRSLQRRLKGGVGFTEMKGRKRKGSERSGCDQDPKFYVSRLCPEYALQVAKIRF